MTPTPTIYDLGDQVNLTGKFYSDAAGTTPADPSTVVLSVRSPSGIVTTLPATRSTLGIWTYPWIPATAGLWEVQWAASGVLVGSINYAIFIREGIAPGQNLCNAEEVKLLAGIPDGRDAVVEMSVRAASRAITNRYQREFVDSGRGNTRRFELEGPRVSLAPYDLQSASLVQLNAETSSPITLTANDGVILRPTGGGISGTYTAIVISRLQTIISSTTIRWGIAYLDVTGVWGFPSIPDDVRRAAIITAAAWTDRAAASYGMDSDGTPGQNTAAMAQTWGIPTAAHRLLQQYERMDYV